MAPRLAIPSRPGRQIATVRASNEGSRPVALPGALWMLGTEASSYYSVRGNSFVINRAEARDDGSIVKKHSKKRGSGNPPSLHQPTANDYLSGMWARPELMLTAAGADVMDVEAECLPQRPASTWLVWVPPQPAGMVRWPLVEGQEDQVCGARGESQQVSNVYAADTKSPRRTKMLKFTCRANACGAVNMRPINPHAFQEGTAFAECGKCGVWHLITDHLNLFHQMKGPVFVDRRSTLTDSDLPPSLRLRVVDEDAGWRDIASGCSGPGGPDRS